MIYFQRGFICIVYALHNFTITVQYIITLQNFPVHQTQIQLQYSEKEISNVKINIQLSYIYILFNVRETTYLIYCYQL